jgi:hypothetical protein
MADEEEFETTSIKNEEELLESGDEEDEEFVEPVEELKADAKKIIIIPNDERRTSNVVSEFEKARLISLIAQLSESEGLDFVDSEHKNTFDNSIDIAKYQFFKIRKCPFKIRRKVNETADTIYYEEWNLSNDEMIY